MMVRPDRGTQATPETPASSLMRFRTNPLHSRVPATPGLDMPAILQSARLNFPMDSWSRSAAARATLRSRAARSSRWVCTRVRQTKSTATRLASPTAGGTQAGKVRGTQTWFQASDVSAMPMTRRPNAVWGDSPASRPN